GARENLRIIQRAHDRLDAECAHGIRLIRRANEAGDLMAGRGKMRGDRSSDIARCARAEDFHSYLPITRHCERSEAIQCDERKMDCLVASLLAMTRNSPQMFLEKFRRPAPCELGSLAVVHGHALLVDEGVLGVVAKKLERLSGGLHRLLETVDQSRRAPVVLVGEMRLQRNLDVGGL